jgi:hypothetical protein
MRDVQLFGEPLVPLQRPGAQNAWAPPRNHGQAGTPAAGLPAANIRRLQL